MSVFDDLQKLADKNGDGKIDKADLDAYIGDSSEQAGKIVADLKKKADANSDGKIDMSELNGVKDQLEKATGDTSSVIGDVMGNAGGVIDGFKDKFFGNK